ncbi:MAG: hypothetical protein WBZ48_09355 [Bacteroidota bacterium]
MRYNLKTPGDCTPEEKDSFFQMEKEANKVAKATLRASIERARLLAFCYDKSSLVGIGSIKYPTDSYKKKVFKSANYTLPADLKYELGYIYTIKSHEGMGIASSIIARLLAAEKSVSMFATTDLTQKEMQHILENHQFKKCGVSYKSGRGSHSLVLYVRSDPTQQSSR